jgi:hypothetical protein
MTLSFYVVKLKDMANQLIWGVDNRGGFEAVLDNRMKEQVSSRAIYIMII